MKILIACDSFKESATSLEVAEWLKKGILKSNSSLEIKIIPVADGGEGTLEAIAYTKSVSFESANVSNPLSREISANWLFIPETKTAVIESAQAIGLPLLKLSERNPLLTHTGGLGTLIINAIQKGAEKIIIGLGGSSTNDGGTAMLKELGINFLDSKNQVIPDGNNGLAGLNKFTDQYLIPNLEKIEFIVACDVDNPLTGKNGATYTYGAQKGASEDILEEMESNMENFRKVLISQGKKDPNQIEGSGAAGGLGCAFSLFLDAEMKPGFNIVKEISGLEDEIKESDLIITGEGKVDNQSLNGKVPFNILNIARKYMKPVILVAGKIDTSINTKDHFKVAFDIISQANDLEDAMKNSCSYLEKIGEEIGELLSK